MRPFSLLTLLLLLLTGCTRSDNAEYGDAMSREHAGEEPTATPIASVVGDEVITARPVYASVGGDSVTGFLARPDSVNIISDEPLPGLLVIHEWWGLNDNIQTMAQRFAEEGYVALAVDLYGGEIAENPEDARRLMSASMEREAMLTDNLTQAFEYLKTQEGVGEIGVIGWCFGGGWSLRTALALPESIDATAIYYGQLITERDQLATLDMPILGIFGAEDQGIPVEGVREFESVLADLGKDAEIEVYDGAGHGFANPSGQRYNAEAAEDAWEKTMAFFDEHLHGEAGGE